MAKIDTSTIEGYAEMSAEQKLAALEGYEMADSSAELAKMKNAFDRASSEAAGYKKQLNERLSEEEKAKVAQQELLEKLEAYEKREKTSRLTASCLELGFDSETAKDTAEALIAGEMDKFFANQKKFIESMEKKIKADLLKQTGRPAGNAGDAPMTKEKFLKMSYQEQLEFKNNNPDWRKVLA